MYPAGSVVPVAKRKGEPVHEQGKPYVPEKETRSSACAELAMALFDNRAL